MLLRRHKDRNKSTKTVATQVKETTSPADTTVKVKKATKK